MTRTRPPVVRLVRPDREATVHGDRTRIRRVRVTASQAAELGLALRPGQAVWIGDPDARPVFPVERALDLDLIDHQTLGPLPADASPVDGADPDTGLVTADCVVLPGQPLAGLRNPHAHPADDPGVAARQPLPWPVRVLMVQGRDARGGEVEVADARRIRFVVRADAQPDVGDRLVVDGQPVLLVGRRADAVGVEAPALLDVVPDGAATGPDEVEPGLVEPLAIERTRWRDRVDVTAVDTGTEVADITRADLGEPLPDDVLGFLLDIDAGPVLQAALEAQSDDPAGPVGSLPTDDPARPASNANWRRLRADVALAGLGLQLVASPDRHPRLQPLTDDEVRQRSAGAVKKPETINHRTHRAERDGLHCERIFGPTRDLECFCGKYSGAEHRGTTCERCGVDVVPAALRYRRSGHIELPVPVVAWWAMRGDPSVLSMLTGFGDEELTRVVWFQDVVVEDDTATGWAVVEPQMVYPDTAPSGPGAVARVLESLTPARVERRLASLEPGEPRARTVLEAWRDGRLTAAHVLRQSVPVLPSGFRPMTAGSKGPRLHDLDELLRRVVNRANRLARLIELDAPHVILVNEERMMQEAAWALTANRLCTNPVHGVGHRQFRSAADFAVRVLDPPPGDDWRLTGTLHLPVRIDPSLADGRLVVPASVPLWTGEGEHAAAVWSADSVAVMRLARDDRTTGPLAAVAAGDAGALHLGDGDAVTIFCPADPDAQAELARHASSHRRRQPRPRHPTDDPATMIDALLPFAVTGESLPFDPLDCLLRIGWLPVRYASE